MGIQNRMATESYVQTSTEKYADKSSLEVFALKTELPTSIDDLHPATAADVSKFLIVSPDGKWSMQLLETEEWTFTLDDGTVVYIGGARTSWELHGPFFMYTDFTASSTSTLITSRVMYLP